ncbi:MAG: hypothetical protein SGJ10_11350 [Bacteroidota bacterium]|nr:hypothetical protein [Bacteroidota bacterium]
MNLNKKNLVLILFGTSSLFTAILFIGQVYHSEDGDRSFFIKYKPTFQQYFYSPKFIHRLQPTKLTLIEDKDEHAFQEYIIEIGVLSRNNGVLLPAILIQLAFTFFICGGFSMYSKTILNYEYIGWQFLINLLITYFGLFFMSFLDENTTTKIVCLSLLSINFLTILFFLRGKRIHKILRS